MASFSSSTARATYNDDSDYEASPPVALFLDNEIHSTVWDPTKDKVYTISGRIGCEMTLPNERLLSVSLSLEQCGHPDRTGTVELFPLVNVTLLESESVSLSAVPNIVDEAKWSLELWYYRYHELPRTLHPQSTPCHFISFKASIPVGCRSFQDKGNGNVTRSFRFFVKSVTKYSTPENPSGIRRVETGEEWFTVTVLDTWKIMG